MSFFHILSVSVTLKNENKAFPSETVKKKHTHKHTHIHTHTNTHTHAYTHTHTHKHTQTNKKYNFGTRNEEKTSLLLQKYK